MPTAFAPVDASARQMLAGLGVNLFDAAGASVDQALHVSGVLAGPLPDYLVTNYIPVAPGQTIRLNAPNRFDGTYGWCFYDASKAYLSGTVGADTPDTPVTVPAGAAFARTSFNTGAVRAALARVVVAPPGVVPVGAGVPTLSEVATYASALHAQENLADNAALTTGIGYRSNGTIDHGPGANHRATDWFAVAPGEAIVANAPCDQFGTLGWQFCAMPGAAIIGVAGTAAGVPVTVPAGCLYARVAFSIVDRPPGDFLVRRAGRGFGRLAGKRWMHFGDSISAKLGGVFQAWVTERTGLTLAYQDARGFRRTDQIFEMYQVAGSPADKGSPSAGLSTGGIIATTLSQAAGDGSVAVGAVQVNQPGPWIAAGSTLAQTLATIDVVTVMLGTNDTPLLSTMGNLSSAAADGSYFGWLKWAYEGLTAAKPAIKIVPVIPPWSVITATATTTATDAMRAYFASVGLECIDLQRESGISALSEAAAPAFLLADKVHPTIAGGWAIGRKLAGRLTAAMA